MGDAMSCRDMLSGRRFVIVAGVAAALALGAAASSAVPLPARAEGASSGLAQAHGGAGTLADYGGDLVPIDDTGTTEEVLRATYANKAQGFALLVDAGTFTVSEDGNAAATFSLTADPSSYFSVSYAVDWEGTPDVGEYMEEQLFAGQMEHPGSFQQVSEGAYELIYLAGVATYGVSYGYVDETTGEAMLVIRAMEPRSDGSAVYWGLVSDEDSLTAVATGLVEASATFRTHAYAGSNVWCDPADLVERPAGSTFSIAGSGSAAADAASGTSIVPGAPEASAKGDVSASATADGSASGTAKGASKAAPGALELTTYDGGYFTATLPAGWTVTTAGTGAGFCLEAYDPANPAVRLVYYGELPFNLDEASRELFSMGALEGGQAGQYSAYLASLPVLDPATVANGVSLLPAYTQLALDGGAVDDGTSLLVSEAQVTFCAPVTYFSGYSALSGYVADDALVSARLTLTDGTACRADFLGSAVTVGYGGYGGMAALCGLWGVIAPEGVYDDVAPTLAQCVGTLSFTDAYVAQSNAQNDAIAAAALQRSAENNAVMDKVMQDFDDYIMDRDRFTFSDGSQLVIQH